jgi:hypothetical protein
MQILRILLMKDATMLEATLGDFKLISRSLRNFDFSEMSKMFGS